jgi:hypothetical protein
MAKPQRLGEIWENSYVCRLGILDHAHEIQTINDEIIRLKNSRGSNEDFTTRLGPLNRHFEEECADLFLILGEYLGDDVKIDRFERFREKAKEA